MNIYFNEKKYQLSEIEQFGIDNPYYLNLIEFIQNWIENKQTFGFQTSGSTGKPKTITITKQQIISSVYATKKALKLNQEDKVLVCLNPEYIATKMMVARCLILDLDMYLVEPSSNPLMGIEESLKLDFVSFVPLQIEAILKSNQANRLQNIRNILIGGAALAKNTIGQLANIKTNIYQTYGMTETVSHIALMNVKTDIYFQTVDGIEIELDDRQCLAIKGEVTNSKWVQTNDVVEMTNHSKFKWLGRIDNIINSGGIKIIPEDLEDLINDLLSQNNYHNSFFFYGQADVDFGEITCLVFEQIQPEIKVLEELKNGIVAKFSKYHLPKKISILDEFLRTKSGKINRLETVKLIH